MTTESLINVLVLLVIIKVVYFTYKIEKVYYDMKKLGTDSLNMFDILRKADIELLDILVNHDHEEKL